jgi:hypothetical protein
LRNCRDRAAIASLQRVIPFVYSFSNSSNAFTARSPPGCFNPSSPTPKLHPQKRTELERLYQKVVDDLEQLLCAVGLKAA